MQSAACDRPAGDPLLGRSSVPHVIPSEFLSFPANTHLLTQNVTEQITRYGLHASARLELANVSLLVNLVQRAPRSQCLPVASVLDRQARTYRSVPVPREPTTLESLAAGYVTLAAANNVT